VWYAQAHIEIGQQQVLLPIIPGNAGFQSITTICEHQETAFRACNIHRSIHNGGQQLVQVQNSTDTLCNFIYTSPVFPILFVLFIVLPVFYCQRCFSGNALDQIVVQIWGGF